MKKRKNIMDMKKEKKLMYFIISLFFFAKLYERRML